MIPLCVLGDIKLRSFDLNKAGLLHVSEKKLESALEKLRLIDGYAEILE